MKKNVWVGLIATSVFLAAVAGLVFAGPVIKDDKGNNTTVKYKVLDHATSGDNTVIAAVTGKKIRVLAITLISAGTVTARFESGAGGTALTGQMTLAVNSGFAINCGQLGCFETAASALLNLELSGNVSVDGFLTYMETP